MQNFDIARDALETSLNSSGSAMAEHAKWSDSLEARLNKLKSTWQSLSQSFLGSDFLKTALDWVVGLVNGVDKLIDTFGTLPTLLTAFSIFKSFSGKGFFKVIEDEAAASGKRITTIFGSSLSNVTKQFNSMGIKTNADFRNSLNLDMQALAKYRIAVNQGMASGDAFNKYMTAASQAAQDYAKSGQLAAKGITEFGKQQKAAQVTMVAQNNSLSSAKAIMQEYNSGCKNTAMNQQDFVNAVNEGNPALGKYLSGLNGAKGSMVGYTASLVGAKVASFALQAATMALNGYIAQGVTEDWATHMIGHELTALAGITHGASLAIVLPATMSVLRDQKRDKILQYGARVWGIDGGSTTERIDQIIARTREFFASLGLATSLTEAEISESVIDIIAERFNRSGVHHGEAANVDGEMARRILTACLK